MNVNELIKPIPDGAPRGWKITDEKGVSIDATSITAEQSRMGTTIEYGQGPEGYDRFAIKEINGGGSVTVPYVLIDGEPYIGAIQQFRSNTGGYVTEVSRGFSLPKESHEKTAKRELHEETGIKVPLTERIYDLGGKPVNPNSTYFVANPHKDEGVKLFGLELKRDEVVLRRDSENPILKVYVFTPSMQETIKETNEKIKPEGIRFFHVDLLRNTPDGFTQVAIAKILTSQRRSGE